MRSWFAAILLAISLTGCPLSEQDLQTAQALVDIGDAVNEMRQGFTDIQDQLDSLKMVMAKQDTIIRTLANLAGVQVPR